jgi:hypothetical protein
MSGAESEAGGDIHRCYLVVSAGIQSCNGCVLVETSRRITCLSVFGLHATKRPERTAFNL